MKRFFSFFILSLFLSAVNLFAQTEPIAHLVVDQSSIEEDGGSTKLRINLKDASENAMNATVVTNVVITISGSATLNTDYSITNATNSDEKIITIPVGASSGFLTINAINDSDVEPEENIKAEISSINVGSIHAINNDRTIKILDDDLLISLKLQAGDTSLLEEASPKTVLRAEINQAVSEDIEVQVGMTGGDAINADVNFTGIVKINDGDTFSDFEIYAIDDNVYESTETFYLKMTNVKSGPGRIVNDSIGFSIIDNDPPKVSFTIDKTEIDEDGGTATLTITLSRVYDKPSTIGLNYEGLDFKAEKDIDFSSNASDQITIAAGNTTAQLTITAIDDNIQDPNENIVIELNNTSSDTPPSSNISYEPNKVTIKINDDENPPIAVNDTYSGSDCVDEGGELIINDPSRGLLANDSDPEGTPLTIAQQSFPLAGIVSCPTTGLPGICSDGTFSYNHQGDETPSGSDSFSYKITDGDGFTATGQVTICVNPVNDCPFVDGEALKVNEGEVKQRDLTEGVLDPEYTLGIDLVLTFEKISDPSVGTLTISPAGIAEYTAPAFITGSDPLNTSFEYKVTDGGGCVKQDVIAIQINNSVPQAVADTFTVGVGGTINIPAPGVLVNDPIPSSATGESGIVTSPTLAITSGPSAFNLNSDGSFTYTHNGSTSPKTDNFTYRLMIVYSPGVFDVSDGQVVIKVNDCPTTVSDTYTVSEGGVLVVDSLNGLLINDSDINGDDIFAFKDSDPLVLADDKASKGSSVVVNADGSFTYTHGGGEGDLDYFLYYANDGLCNSVPDTVKIVVLPVNDCPVTYVNGYNSLSLLDGAPIKDYIEALTDAAGNPISIDSVRKDAAGDTLLVFASDGIIWVLGMDEGGTLTRDSLTGALLTDIDPEGDYIFMRELLPGSPNWILDAAGNPVYPFPPFAKDYQVNADGSFYYEHDGSGNIRDVIYVEVCDVPQTGVSCCSVDSIRLFFGPDNACAEGLTDYFTVNEGGTLTADGANLGYNTFMDSMTKGDGKYTGVLLNDVDEEGDTLNVALNELPIFGTIVGNKINPDGSFVYVHDGGEQTADSFTYTMGDMARECAEVRVYINIISVNECPTAVDTVYTVEEGGTLVISGLPGGGEGHFNNLPAIMGNDFDIDIGSRPQITDDLIAFYSMSEFYDSLPGPDLDVDGKLLPTILVHKKADDQSSNNFNGFMRGGVPDTLALPNPPGCDALTGGKCSSPPYLITYPDAPTIVPDRFQPPKDRNAFGFDGVNSFVEVEDQIIDLSRNRYTISGWFRSFHASTETATILNFTVDGKEKGLTIGIKDEKVSIAIGNGSGYSVKTETPLGSTTLNNQWNHFVFMKNANNYKMFLNKKEIYSESLNLSSLSGIASAKLLMGRSLSGNFFRGRMDELYIFGDTISQEQILKLYYGLSTSLTNAPDDGVLTDFNTDGSFTYVHSGKDNDFEDNFIYELSDGECTDLGKVTIVITPTNDCPIGVNDTLRVDEGGTVVFDAPGVLTNDTDEENDTLKAEKLTDPLHGIVTLGEDGKIEYIHDDTETLLDSMTYILKDSTCTDTATVYIIINPVADCPIPVDDVYYVTEGDTLTVDSCVTAAVNKGSNNENWAAGEPNSSGDENIGEIYSDGTWNDEKQTTLNQRYLLEVDNLISSKSGYTYLGQYNGHTYFSSNLSFLWFDAKADAEANGGYLATIKTKDENDAVAAMLSSGKLHFGLYQDVADPFFAEPKGGWKWVDGTYLYDEGKMRTLCGILLNDDDGGGDTLFVNDWTLPVNGILDNNELKYDGKFKYFHDGSQLGDTILYRIESELCPSDSTKWGKIIIIPINVNDCPVAIRDTFYIDEGATLDTLGILINDIDEDGDNLRTEKDSLSDTNHGVSQIFPNGRLLYQHDGSESSIDSVKYKAIDPSGCSSQATIIIIINRVNDPPVGVDDNYSVNEGDTLVVDVAGGLLANDSDVDNDSTDLKVLVITGVSVGTLTVNPDGSFTYIHDGTDSPNEVCFTYRVFDGVNGPPPGLSELTEVCITILNRVPICDGENYILLEGEVLTTDLTNGVLANCTDPDPQDIMTVILDTPPVGGAFVLNDDGTFSYDHDCSDDPDETFFTYYVTDGEDTTATVDTAWIDIENECPIGNDDLYSGVDEGGVLTIGPFDGVLSNDSDQNPCDILEIKLLDPPSFGGVVLNSDGSFEYTHDDSENFIDEYTYLLHDGECPTWDTVTVTIRIDPVPDTPPVAVEDSYGCIDEGSFIQTLFPVDGVLANDYDLDTGQTLTAVLVVYPLHGTLILNPNGTFMYTHDGGESTSDSFVYYAVDNTGLSSDTVTVSICINPVNDCPVPVDDIFNIKEGDVIDSTLVFNDFDVEGNELLISINSPPTLGGFSWSQDGSFTYTAPDDIPAPGPEIITFDYILTDIDDGFASCDSTATVTIIVNYENDCPIVEDDSILVDGSVASSRIISVLDNDYDPDSEIDTTSVKIIGGPTFGDAISNIDGTITYNFDESPIPFDTITYSVSDYEGCEVLGKIYIYIENLRTPKYQLPNYFTPNGDDFNDYFVIKHENILEEDMRFEVKIFDRYQRLIYNGVVESTDKVWDGSDSNSLLIVKTDFYYYEITPLEYFNTPYARRRDTLIGTVYLQKER